MATTSERRISEDRGCPACKAPILRKDERIDSFHQDCYIAWIASLYAELEGKLTKVRAA